MPDCHVAHKNAYILYRGCAGIPQKCKTKTLNLKYVTQPKVCKTSSADAIWCTMDSASEAGIGPRRQYLRHPFGKMFEIPNF